MKRIFFIILLLLFTTILSKDIFVQRDDGLYKITIDENGDTLSIEKLYIQNEKNDTTISFKKQKEYEYDAQLLKNIIPYNWQIGLFGLWQGSFYGISIANAILPDNFPSREIYISISGATMPVAMLFAPAFIVNEDIDPISIPIIDYGYRIGPMDYFLARTLIMNDPAFNRLDWGLVALTGYTEAWGGYYIVKDKDYTRAAGHMYSTGALLGDLWGFLAGTYMTRYFSDTIRTITGFSLGYSALFRSLGFYMGNREDMHWCSFDSYIISMNTLVGMGIITDINRIANDSLSNTLPLQVSIAGMLTSLGTGYLLYKTNTHFDDGNAILSIFAGMTGAMLGSSLNLLTNDFYFTLPVIGMLAGEYAVYSLRKNSLPKYKLPQNINLNIMPTLNKGIEMSMNIKF